MPPKLSGPKIKPQAKVAFETCTFKIDGPTLIRLKAYCQFIDSEQSYVIREALNFLFQSDSAFQTYLDDRNGKVEVNSSAMVAGRLNVDTLHPSPRRSDTPNPAASQG